MNGGRNVKINIWCELLKGSDIIVPDWVKTKEDFKQFIDEYARQNISVGFDVVKVNE